MTILLTNMQLFEDLSFLEPKDEKVLVLEDPTLGMNLSFHMHKLVLLSAAARRYAKDRGYTLLKAKNGMSALTSLAEYCKKHDITQLRIPSLIEKPYVKKLQKALSGVTIEQRESPYLLTSLEQFKEQGGAKDHPKMQHFYIAQRKRLGILLEPDGSPTGGAWSFDKENRKKVPKGTPLPSMPQIEKHKITEDVINEVMRDYKDHPGNPQEFYLPTSHKEAVAWLESFLKHRFEFFGTYEDAIIAEDAMLFHSMLSPLLNIGLLTPTQVVDAALEYAKEHHTPINSLEGFIRQIIGWREFVAGIYQCHEEHHNFFNHHHKLTSSWYEGNTGIRPLDTTINRVMKFGYAHHIERLMVLSNLMLLCEIDPDEVYHWFMELFVDAYDWVMVPNVYGMGQFADGGLFATKPYISGSNYIKKMSNYEQGDWTEQWDALYWRFINKHRGFFEKQPRLSMMVAMLDKMDPVRRSHLMTIAEDTIGRLTQ